MNKTVILSILLPVLAGSTAGLGNVQDLYNEGIVYQDHSQSTFTNPVKKFINESFKKNNCNPKAHYKIQSEVHYPISDLSGNTEIAYSAELRVFDESDQGSFNGYEGSRKFRIRKIIVHETSKGFVVSTITCEKNGWQRTRL